MNRYRTVLLSCIKWNILIYLKFNKFEIVRLIILFYFNTYHVHINDTVETHYHVFAQEVNEIKRNDWIHLFYFNKGGRLRFGIHINASVKVSINTNIPQYPCYKEGYKRGASFLVITLKNRLNHASRLNILIFHVSLLYMPMNW